jgi:hypothetical protein
MDTLLRLVSPCVTTPLIDMVNLLSQRAKNSLWNEYRIRLIIVVLAALLLLELCTALFFLPTFLVLRSTTDVLASDIEKQKLRLPENATDMTKQLTAIKGELAALRPSAKSTDTSVSALFLSILELKPSGIAISAIAYQKEKEGVSIQLSGLARAREDILSFKNTLSMNPAFIVRSNDYILQKTDGSFTITLNIK